MKIVVLSRNKKLYSTRRLVEAAEMMGHEVEVIDFLKCYMVVKRGNPEVYHYGKKLKGVDAVIPRIGASRTFYGTAVVRQFEMMHVFPVNESQAIARSRDKLRSMQILARAGIGMPVTAFASDPTGHQPHHRARGRHAARNKTPPRDSGHRRRARGE